MKTVIAVVLLAFTQAGYTSQTLNPTNYSMNNGHGVASGGQFNYWDLGYSGNGMTDADNDFLSGGQGDLTDGAVTTLNWHQIENLDGTGPYVGWRQSVASPQISFNFDGPVDIDTVSVHADDSNGAGGVSLPTMVHLTWETGSASYSVYGSSPGYAPSWLPVIDLSIENTRWVTVSFSFGNEWVFVDEVSFMGLPAVPEPASWALMAVGLAGLGVRVRRRR